MPTNDLTPNEGLPRPHPDNTVAEDFARIITLVNALDAKIADLRSQILGKANTAHTHAIANVTGLQTALDAKQAATWRPALGDLLNVSVSGAALGQVLRYDGTNWIPSTLSVAWGDISGKPSSFPTAWADVTGKPTAFTPSTHAHNIADISGLQTALDGKLSTAGGVVGGTLINADGSLEINRQGSGDRASYIDLHAFGLPAAGDYATRIIRNAGANGAFDIINTGGGEMRFIPGAGAPISFGGQGAGNYGLFRRQVNSPGALEGGALRLELPVASSLTNSLQLDINGDSFRAFEAAAPARGFNVNIAQCAPGAGSALIHSGNFRANLAAGDTQELGNYVFALHVGAQINFGQLVAGTDLRATSHVANFGPAMSGGSWRNHGHATSSAQGLLFERVVL